MGWMDRLLGSGRPSGPAPRANAADVLDLSDSRIQEFLRFGGVVSASGEIVTPEVALKIATAYRCMDIISGALATMPLNLIRRVDARTREEADDHPLFPVLCVKPNAWQTPSEFKRLMIMNVLLRGNGYALKVRSRGQVTALNPLIGAMTVHQNDDLTLSYTYTVRNGGQIPIDPANLVHFRGLSLDGVHGLSVIQYGAQALGLASVTDKHTSRLFRNGAKISAAITSDKPRTPAQRDQLKESLDRFRGADQEDSYKELILEGYEYEKIGMSSVDAQLLQLKELNQYEVAMFFGVPPYMLGLTSKATSWGAGIEQQGIGFVQYTLNKWLVMYQEVIGRDLLGDDPKVVCRLDPAGLLKGDMKSRYAGFAIGRQWGWLSPNDIREKEDMNPIENGDTYYEPINMQPIGTGNDKSSDGDPTDPGKESDD